MKLALHRSITFWSGLLVMGFVCWAWWDSKIFHNRVAVAPYVVESAYAGLSVKLDPLFSATNNGVGRSMMGIGTPTVTECFFYRAGGQGAVLASDVYAISYTGTFQERSEFTALHREAPYWHGFVAYWLILLVVAMFWLGLLVWRARRRAAATKQVEG